jgi:hypothetical protein
MKMQNFKVKAWHDYHGDPILFMVVDEWGHECGRFVSEEGAERISHGMAG